MRKNPLFDMFFLGELKLLRTPMVLLAMGAIGVGAGEAWGNTLRIVSYNIDCADQNSDNNITGSAHTLPNVIHAIALHHIGTNAQPVDIIGLEELYTTSLVNLTSQLNSFYGAGTYAYDSTTDPSPGGGGPEGIIYNTNTIKIISARALVTGTNVLLQSNGTYITAHSPGGGTKGVPRAPMCYQIRPIGFGATNDFYMYVSHARSSSDNSVGDARYAEAQEVRSDAKYNLPAGSHILYSGDWNLFNGSGENAYKCLTGQTTSDSINWADTSAIWANTNQTQAYDPTSKTSPPTTTTFANSSSDGGTYLYDDSTEGTFASRLDIQLPNALMFAAYNSKGGVQLGSDTNDPYDSSNFPSSQYPYAFEVFGNNGTVPRLSAVTNSSNHSLDDLTNAATIKSYILLTGSGSTFTGSDHYPIFGDYNIVIPAPTVTPPTKPTLLQQGFTNGYFQLKLYSTSNTTFHIQASSNLLTWTNIGTASTGTNGVLSYQDTNTGSYLKRYYRAFWP